MEAVELETKWDILSPSIRAVIITLGCNDEKAWEDCDSLIELATQIQVLQEKLLVNERSCRQTRRNRCYIVRSLAIMG